MTNSTAGAGNEPTVRLTADATAFEAALRHAADAGEQMAARIQAQMSRVSNAVAQNTAKVAQQTSVIQQKIDGFSLSIQAKIADVLVDSVNTVAVKFHEGVFGLKEFDKRIVESVGNADRYAQMLEKVADRQRQMIETASNADPAAGRRLRTNEAKRLDAVISSEEANRKNYEDRLKKLKGFDPNLVGPANLAMSPGTREIAGLYASGKLEGTIKEVEAKLAASKLAVAAARTRKSEVQDELDRGPNSKFQWEINARVAALKAEGEMWYATAEQMEQYRLQLEKATPEQIRAVVQAQEVAMEGRRKKAIDEMEKSLRKQADTINLNNDELEIYEARLHSATAAEIERIKHLQSVRNEEQRKNILKEANKDLEKQAALWGLNADQAARFELKLKGLNEEQIKQYEAKQFEQKAIIAAKLAAVLPFALGAKKDGEQAPEVRGVSANIGGTREAANAIVAASRTSSNLAPNNPQVQAAKGIADLNQQMREQLRATAATNRTLESLLEEFRGIGVF